MRTTYTIEKDIAIYTQELAFDSSRTLYLKNKIKELKAELENARKKFEDAE